MFDLRALACASAMIAATVAPPALCATNPSDVVHTGLSAPAKAWGAAMEAGDLAALARMHDARTLSYPPGEVETRGVDAIMKGYADLFAHYTVRVTTDEAFWIEQPPLVVSWGRTTLTLHPKAGGADVVSHTRFTDAAVKTADGWRYVVDHASKTP